MTTYSTLPEYVEPPQTPEVVPNRFPQRYTDNPKNASEQGATRSGVYSTLPEYIPPPTDVISQQHQYLSEPKYTGGGTGTSEAPDVAANKSSKKKRKIWILAAVTILIVVAAIVGAVCGTLLTKKNSSNTNSYPNKYVHSSSLHTSLNWNQYYL